MCSSNNTKSEKSIITKSNLLKKNDSINQRSNSQIESESKQIPNVKKTSYQDVSNIRAISKQGSISAKSNRFVKKRFSNSIKSNCKGFTGQEQISSSKYQRLK